MVRVRVKWADGTYSAWARADVKTNVYGVRETVWVEGFVPVKRDAIYVGAEMECDVFARSYELDPLSQMRVWKGDTVRIEWVVELRWTRRVIECSSGRLPRTH